MKRNSLLDPKKRYLQVALNGTLSDARRIISQLPRSERIIVEAGTPLIKRYGAEGIRRIKYWYRTHLMGQNLVYDKEESVQFTGILGMLLKSGMKSPGMRNEGGLSQEMAQAYVVADLKMMDRGSTEVQIAAEAGASGAVALGMAPVESLDAFMAECEEHGVDAMVDMMNVEQPYKVLRKLKQLPQVVILHRGVDEEEFSDKPLPIQMINKIKGAFNVMVSVAGGDKPREIQSAVFNGADIVVVWKNFYRANGEAGKLAEEFLMQV